MGTWEPASGGPALVILKTNLTIYGCRNMSYTVLRMAENAVYLQVQAPKTCNLSSQGDKFLKLILTNNGLGMDVVDCELLEDLDRVEKGPARRGSRCSMIFYDYRSTFGK